MSHVTFARTRPTARLACSLAGSSPMSCNNNNVRRVGHSGKRGSPGQVPSSDCAARSAAPQPSVAILARSAAISSSDASVKSRIACQRIEGSESSSHWIADLSGFGICHVDGWVVICWFSYYAVGGLAACIVRRRFGITHLAIFACNSSLFLLFPHNNLLLGFQLCIDKFA